MRLLFYIKQGLVRQMLKNNNLIKYSKVLDGGGLVICTFLILVKKINTFLQYRSVKGSRLNIVWGFVFYQFLTALLRLNVSLITPGFLQFLNSIRVFVGTLGETSGFEQELLKFFTSIDLNTSGRVVGLQSVNPTLFNFSNSSAWFNGASSVSFLRKDKIIKIFAYTKATVIPQKNVTVNFKSLEVGDNTLNFVSSIFFRRKCVISRFAEGATKNITINSKVNSCNVLRYLITGSVSVGTLKRRVLGGLLFFRFSTWFLKQSLKPCVFKVHPRRSVNRRWKIKKFQHFLKQTRQVINFYKTTTLLLNIPVVLNKKINFSYVNLFKAKTWLKALNRKYFTAGLRVKSKKNVLSKKKEKLFGFTGVRTFSTSKHKQCFLEFTNGFSKDESNIPLLDQNFLHKTKITNLTQFNRSASESSAVDSNTGGIPLVSRQYFFKRCALGFEWKKPFGISYFKTLPFETSRTLAPGFSRTLGGAIKGSRALELARVLFNEDSLCLNIPVSSYVGGNVVEFVNSFFRRRSVKWVVLRRRRVSFRRLRLVFFNTKRLLNTRSRSHGLFKNKLQQFNFLHNRGNQFQIGGNTVHLAKRYFKRKLNPRTLSTFFFKELMFGRRKSNLRTAYLRKCLHFVRVAKRVAKANFGVDQKIPSWMFWLKRRRIHFYWKIFRKRKPQKTREVRLRVRRQLRNFKVLWRNWNLTRLKMSYASLLYNPGHKPTVTGCWYRRTLRRRQSRKLFGKRARRLYSKMANRLIVSRWLGVHGFKRLTDSEEDRLSIYQDSYLPWLQAQFNHTDLFFARGLLRFSLGKPKRVKTIASFKTVGAAVRAVDVVKIKEFKF